MYIIKDNAIDELKIYKQKEVAYITGLHPVTLSRIVGKQPILEKKVAYCLTKFLNSEKEIKDYFEIKERN